MLKRLLGILALSSLLLSGAYADDILAIVSKGQLTSNSAGVKELSLEEKMQVKGGYRVEFLDNGSQWNVATERYAIAIYEQGEMQYVINYLTGNEGAKQGLCGIGQTTCANPSKNRLTAFFQVTQNSIELLPVYTVKRQIQYSRSGTPYVLFTYGVGAYNPNTYKMYKFNSTLMLNNNMLIKEIANKYKSSMESQLGGWSVR